MASCMSPVIDESTCVRFSRSMPAWREPDLELGPHHLLGHADPPRRVGGDEAAVERAASCSSSSGTTRRTSPMRSASPASMMRPVSISSHAREAPISRGRSQLAPMSQPERPRRTKATLKRADAARSGCRSPVRGRGRPPPPDRSRRRSPAGAASADRGTSAAMSVWVANVVPDPVQALGPRARRRTRRGRSPHRSPARLRSARRPGRRGPLRRRRGRGGARRSAAFIAFNLSGRFRVIRVTPSWGWSTCSVSMVGSLRSARPYPATDGTAAAAGGPRRDGNTKWDCTTRASSTPL